MAKQTNSDTKERARATLVRHGLAGGEVERFDAAELEQLAAIAGNSAAELGRVLVRNAARLAEHKATSDLDELPAMTAKPAAKPEGK